MQEAVALAEQQLEDERQQARVAKEDADRKVSLATLIMCNCSVTLSTLWYDCCQALHVVRHVEHMYVVVETFADVQLVTSCKAISSQ